MLKATLKAHRKEMVRQLTTLAAEHGATISVTPEGSTFYTKRGFHTTLSRDGLNVNISVHGDSVNGRNDDHVASWHMDTDCDKRLSGTFKVACRDIMSRNPHKATTVTHGFESMLLTIADGFDCVADGTAFDPPLPERMSYRLRVFYSTATRERNHIVDAIGKSINDACDTAYAIVRKQKRGIVKIHGCQMIGSPTVPETTAP